MKFSFKSSQILWFFSAIEVLKNVTLNPQKEDFKDGITQNLFASPNQKGWF